MSSVGRTGKSRERNTKQHTHDKTKTQYPHDQQRLAQMTQNTMDKTEQLDPKLAKKVKELSEMTGKSNDEIYLALHDCDNDINRAANLLLEGGNSDQGEWKTTSKKKKAPQKTVEQNHKDRDPSPDVEYRDFSTSNSIPSTSINNRDTSRGRRGRAGQTIPRLARGRGANNSWKNKENEENENNRSESRGGRGRGRGGRGPGRGRGGRFDRPARFDRPEDDNNSGDMGVFSSNSDNVFNVASESDGFGGTWSNDMTTTNETKSKANGKGSWETEDWNTDEWQGDLKESKVFTPSVSAPSTTTAFTALDSTDPLGQRLDLGSLLNPGSKPTEPTGSLFQPSKPNDNSLFQQPVVTKPQDATSLFNSPPKQQTTSLFQDVSKVENDPIVSLLQQTQNLTGGNGLPNNDAQQQFMSAFAKQATETIKNAVGIGGSPSQPGTTGAPSSLGGQLGGTFSQSLSSSRPQPTSVTHQMSLAAQRQKASAAPRIKYPPTKIPASAVEMPGHLPTGGLNDVQFGIDLSSETVSFGFGGDTTPTKNYPKTSSVETSQPSSMGSHDTLATDATGSVFQNNTSSTPPGAPNKDYTPPGLQQNKIGPEPIPFPTSQERTSMPHLNSQRNSQNTGSLNTPTSQQLPYTQAGYPSSYHSNQSSGYTGHKAGYPTNVSNQNQYYQTSSSFQNSNSLYQNNATNQSSNSYNARGSASTENSYQTNSGSPSAYPSGNTTGGGYPSSNGTSGSAYQGSTTTAGVYANTGSYSNDPSRDSRPYSGGSGASQSSYQTPSVAPGFPAQPSSATSSSYHSRDSSGNYSPNVSQTSFPTQVTQSSSYRGDSSQSNYPSSLADKTQSSSYPRDTQTTSGYHSKDSQSNRDSTRDSYGSSYVTSNSQTLNNSATKLSDTLAQASLKDATTLDSSTTQNALDATASASLTTTTATTASSLATSSVSVSSVLSSTTTPSAVTSVTSTKSSTSATMSKTTTLPPGVLPPMLNANYPAIVGTHGGTPLQPYFNLPTGQQPVYSYEDMQLLQQRLHLTGGYYDMALQGQANLATRDQNSLPGAAATNTAYAPGIAGTDSKLAPRVETAQSPPGTQTSQPQQTAAAHQGFINTGLPPGYSYYYPGQANVLPYFNPAMIVPPVSNVPNTVGQAASNSLPYQKPYSGSQYDAAATYDDVTGQADYAKTAYGSAPLTSKPSVGALASSGVGISDLTAAGYGKSHSGTYDKTGSFTGNTPPPFNTNMAAVATGTQASHLAGALPQYPFMPVMPQQVQHIQQDSGRGVGGASQQAVSSAKATAAKAYGTNYGWSS